MFQDFMKMSADYQLLVVVGVLVILFALFWPRETPLAGASLAANIGNIGGKIQLEAYDDYMEEGLDESFDQKAFVLFYVPWCPHCKKIMGEWDKLKQMNKTDINIIKIDCDANPEVAEKFGIKGYPTIKFLPYGLNNPKDRVDYQGERKGEALLAFISNQ